MKKMENRHSIAIRLFHWSNMISITLLILTGFYIHAPNSFRWLFSNMDTPRMLHFAMAYVLLFGVIGRVYYAIVAKDAHNIVFQLLCQGNHRVPFCIRFGYINFICLVV